MAGMSDRPRPGTLSTRRHRSRWSARSCIRGGSSGSLPVQIGARLGVPASTVHAVLVRCRLNRLSHIDRVTGEPARRYERSRPGELLHVDVTKFGDIPDGGDWRFVGIEQGCTNRQATRDRTGKRSKH